MLNLDEIKNMLAEADEPVLTLYLNTNNAEEANQATNPLWRVWLAEEAASTITRVAAAAHPHETGGVLVGVHTRGSRPWVTHAVELRSPKATSTFYEVPAGARLKAIARLRRRDARLGYLGEWHVHPARRPAQGRAGGREDPGPDGDADRRRPAALPARS